MLSLRFIKKQLLRAMSLVLVLAFFAATLASCSSDMKVVGKVGEYEVYYEELYFLATSYKAGLESVYGAYDALDAETAKKFDDELRELVYSNITTNYAILALCAEHGLTLEDDGLDDRVDEYIDELVTYSFGGKKGEYKRSLKEFGLTDHYVRFTAAVDILYSDLQINLLQTLAIEQDDEKIRQIVKEEFARTWHIMIFNDAGDSVEDNRAKAEEALKKLRDGSMSMYKLIGSSYNEDLSLADLDGIYFARGGIDENYENTAFALEVGEVSDVIEVTATNPQGLTVSAFCIMQRLEIEDEYITEHIEELKQKYVDSVIFAMLEEKKQTLKFAANEFADSLAIATLDK